MAQSLASDSMHPAGKLPPTLTPTGHFAGKPTLPISRSVTLIGSRKQARLQLISSSVSQNHALIVNADSGPYVRDLASREHTYVNGIEVKEGALGDGDELQIGRFTFRFNESPHTQPVEAIRNIKPAPQGRMQVDGERMPVPIEGKTLLIGRRETCDIRLLEPSASTVHAILFEMDGRRYLRDLASRTGTFVNGKQIHQVELMPGDEVRVGDTRMRYAAEGMPVQESFAPTAAADLGVDTADLVDLDTTNEAPDISAPGPIEPLEPVAPAAAAAAGTPAAADMLEVVHDEPAETEEVELAPVELEAQPQHEEHEPAVAGIDHDLHVGAAPQADAAANDDFDLMALEALAPDSPAAEAPAPEAPAEAELPVEEVTAPSAETLANPPDELEIEELESPAPAAGEAAGDGDDFLIDLEPLAVPEHAPATAEAPAAEESAAEPLAPAAFDDAAHDEVELEPAEFDLDSLESPEPAAGAPAPHDAAAANGEHAAEEDVELEPLGEEPVAEEPAPAAEEPEHGAELHPPPVARTSLPPGTSYLDLAPISDNEIDLSADPDLVGPDDTAALRLPPETQRPAPKLSDRIVEAPEEEETVAPAAAAEAPEHDDVQLDHDQLAHDAQAADESDEIELAEAAAPAPSAEELAEAEPADAGEAFDEVLSSIPASPEAAAQNEEPAAEAPAAPHDEEQKPAPAAAEIERPAKPEPLKPAAAAQRPAEVAPVAEQPRPQPTQVTPARSVVQRAKDEAFAIPAKPAAPAPAARAPSAAPATPPPPAAPSRAAAAAAAALSAPIEELSFEDPDLAALENELGLSPRLAEMATGDVPPLTELEEPALDEVPKFEEPDLSTVDFAAPPPEAVSDDVFAPIDEASVTVPPLDLGEEEPIPGLDMPTVAGDVLDLGLGAAIPAAGLADTIVGEQTPIFDAAGIAEAPKRAEKPKSKRKAPSRRKKTTAETPAEVETAPVQPVAEAPAEPEPVAPLRLEPPPMAPTEEVLAPTSAEPESALPLEEAAATVAPEAPVVAEEPAALDLTDTSFARAVDDFAGESTGPLVEQPPAAAEAPWEANEAEVAPPAEPLAAGELDDLAEPPAPTRFPAGASQLDLEPVGEEAVRPSDEPLPAAEVEVEPEPLPEPQPQSIEAVPPPLVQQPAPPKPPAAVDDDSALELLAQDLADREPRPGDSMAMPPGESATNLLDRGAPAPAAPHEDDDRLFDLAPHAPEDEAARTHDVGELALEPLDETPAAEEVELAPVESAPPPPAAKVPPAPPRQAPPAPRRPAAKAEAVEEFNFDDLEPLPEVEAAEEAPAPVAAKQPAPPPAAPARPAAAEERPKWEEDLELEPLEPAAEARKPAAPTPPAPARPAAAAQAAPPPQPATPPPAAAAPKRTSPNDLFNWGANQEHFFGGMPLKLGPGAAAIPPAAAAGAAGAAAAAAAAGMPTARPAPQQPGARPPAAGAPPRQPAAPAPRVQQQPPQPPRQQPQQQQPRPMPRPMPAQPSPFATGVVNSTPPAGAGGAAGGHVRTGFDGLAMPPVRDADVFGQGGVPGSLTGGFDAGLANDVFSGAGGNGRRGMPTPQPNVPQAPAPQPASAGAQRSGPRRATKAEPPGDAWSPPSLHPDADAGTEARPAAGQRPTAAAPDAPPPPKKKKRWFGLRSLLVLAILGAGGAAAGIYTMVPDHSSVAGQLKFSNFDGLTREKRVELWKREQALLARDEIRDAARNQVIAHQVPEGFLGDPLAYSRTVSTAGFDLDKGILSIGYVGGAAKPDQQRMLALLQAIYDSNKADVDEAAALKRTLASLTTERAAASKRVDEIKQQIDDLATVAQNKPDVAERTQLESEAARLEAAYNQAVATVTRLSAELQQVRDNPAAGGAPTTAPAGASSNDAVLAQLQGEMQQLNDRVAAIQDGRSQKAKEARAKLEASIESFNQQLQQAQVAVKDKPELLAYLGNAQRLLTSSRELTDKLINSQQEQYTRLSSLKQQMNDKMMARRAEVWKRDPELVKLMDEKDIQTRRYNAAVASGLTKDAEDLKTQLALLDSSIKARQTMVADDGFYADAIDQLQKIIDATQKGLEDDRKRTMQTLDEMQASLTRSQPALDNLTPEQKQLAADTEKRLADVRMARQQYTEAADAANKQADEDIRTLQANASALQSKVQARKQELAGNAPAAGAAGAPPVPPVAAAPDPAAQAKALEQKQRELAMAEKTRSDAEAAFTAANKKLTELKARLDAARAAGEKRDELVRQRDIEQRNLDQLINQYEMKKELAAAKAYPVQPTPDDVKPQVQPDQRPRYTLMAVGGIAVLCTFTGLLGSLGGGSSNGGGGGGRRTPSDPETLPVLPQYPPQRKRESADADDGFEITDDDGDAAAEDEPQETTVEV